MVEAGGDDTGGKIHRELERIISEWRSQTTAGQRREVAFLDDLLGELDDLEPDRPGAVEDADELRARIEVLMDEIDVSLGIEPPPITGYHDIDLIPAPDSAVASTRLIARFDSAIPGTARK